MKKFGIITRVDGKNTKPKILVKITREIKTLKKTEIAFVFQKADSRKSLQNKTKISKKCTYFINSHYVGSVKLKKLKRQSNLMKFCS